jgi:succinate dehydrogenase / fumarate reductase cytochrome b subunit
MAQPERPLSPFLHYRWQYTNTLSILHRITGVVLSVGFMLLVYWLAAAAAGPERYARALETLASPLAQLLLFGGVLSFSYHLLNGIRHLFWDAGYGFELPTARKSGWAVAVASVVLALVLWFMLAAAVGVAA